MNNKLIYRAAAKYHKWMITQSREYTPANEERIHERLDQVTNKTNEISLWVKRFFKGSTPKRQICPYEDTEHIGIINPSVYRSIADAMIPDLANDVSSQMSIIVAMMKSATNDTEIVPISLQEAINEIQVINDAWPEVKFRDDIISVKIENVTVSDETEDVDLGAFWISVDLNDPMGYLSIESIDNVESEQGYCHPHVSGNKLCTGDGEDPMADALCQGRLEDYFRVVEATLRTYNPDSPYEQLCKWYDPSHDDEFLCEGCEKWMADESGIYCEGCGTTYCEDCFGGGCCTECDSWFCRDCRKICKICGSTICLECALKCECCKVILCSSCANTCGICETYCCESCCKPCTCCGEIICSDCQEDCEHCGVPMCKSCLEYHNCMLEGVKNE